jgi:diguanylate cyclase (GGDEF)-like protein
MQPHEDDTCPLRLPVQVAGARSCRPALTRIAGPRRGETVAVPSERRAGVILGRSSQAQVQVDDAAASREHCRVWCDAQGVVRVTDLQSTNGTLVNGKRVEEVVLVEGDKIQVGAQAVFRFALNDRLDEDWLEHLYQTSIRDSLTGLLNRRYLSEALERDLGLARRHGLPMSLLMMDVDHFKAINDSFGHPAGDEVLREMGTLLADMQRRESLLARFGGEEFAVFLRNVAPAGVEIFGERMRMAVERHRFPVPGGTVRLTMSIGIAVTTADGVESPEALVERADRYLYLSKSRGRNRVTCARTAAG